MFLQKFKEGGFPWLFNATKSHLYQWINRRYVSYYQKKLPIQENLIVMESEGDLSDNAYVLYDYMRQNGYLNRYRVVWLVDDLESAERNKFPNTEFVKKNPTYPNRYRAQVLATCKWFIFDHNNVLATSTKRKGQILFNIWHGVGYKAIKGDGHKDKEIGFDYFDSLSDDISLDFLSKFLRCDKSRGVVLGYPRLDYFFRDNQAGRDFVDKLKINNGKVILWMPTFRQSTTKSLSEDYDFSETGLPILYTKSDLDAFDAFLKSKNITVVLKVHHLQAKLPVFKEKFSNLVFVNDEQLKSSGVQLYQFISATSALITDYSSIAIDYMLLNRPIVYTLDDFDEYGKSRGFYTENVKDYMPGYHVYDYDELIDAITEINTGEDVYELERNNICSRYHTYKDGNSSQRILDFLRIEK